MIRSILITLLFAAIPASVLAEGFYGELLVGQTEQKSELDGVGTFTEDDVAIGVQLGFQFLPFLAVEGGYTDHGKASRDHGALIGVSKMETTVAHVGMKGILPLGDVVRLYARAGLGWWDYDISHDSPIATFSSGDKGKDFYYGAGVHFNLSEVVYLGVEYNQMKMEADVAGFDVDHTLRNLALKVGLMF